MNDLELIYLILAVFYLAECAHWARPGSLIFVSQLSEPPRRRSAHSNALLRNDSGGVLFGNFLPVGYALAADAWPLSLSPQGIVSSTRQTLTPDQRLDGERRYLPWDRVRDVRAEGRTVEIAGRPFVQTACAVQARNLAALLDRLSGLEESRREAAIIEMIEQALGATALADTLRTYRRRSTALTVACTALLAYVFAVAPWLLYGEFCSFLGILPGYFALLLVVTLAYHRTHRVLGRSPAERWSATWLMLVSPADAIHSRDRLLRPLAADYHPVAVAYALGKPGDFQDFARSVLLDSYFPLPGPLDETLPGEALAVEGWFHDRWRTALEAFLCRAGLDPETLAQPPQPESAECLSYCPRCHGQYLFARGTCSTCELSVQSFAAPVPPRPAPVQPEAAAPTSQRNGLVRKRRCRRK